MEHRTIEMVYLQNLQLLQKALHMIVMEHRKIEMVLHHRNHHRYQNLHQFRIHHRLMVHHKKLMDVRYYNHLKFQSLRLVLRNWLKVFHYIHRKFLQNHLSQKNCRRSCLMKMEHHSFVKVYHLRNLKLKKVLVTFGDIT